MTTAMLIAAVVLADSAGDILLTKGMRQVGAVNGHTVREILNVLGSAVRNRPFIASLLCMAVHLVGFLILLSWADLSFVFPATALVYVISTLAAKFLLGEQINPYRWAGTVLVCIGVALVALP